MTTSWTPTQNTTDDLIPSPLKYPIMHSLTYYQSSFLKIIRYIKDKFKPILLESEIELLERLHKLNDNPQRLFIRLFLRKNGWIRQSKLIYEEINIEEAVRTLLDQHLLEQLLDRNGNTDVVVIDDDGEDVKVLMSLLNNEDLKSIWTGLHLTGKVPARRDDFEKIISDTPSRIYKNQLCTVDGHLKMQRILVEKASLIRKVAGRAVRIDPDSVNLLQRLISGLFFMNTSLVDDSVLTMNDAILSDLNRQRYPKYILSDPMLIFPTRDAWLRFEGAIYHERDIYEELEADLDILTICDRVKLLFKIEQWTPLNSTLFLRRYTPGWIYCRLLIEIASVLERKSMHQDAVDIYRLLLEQTVFCSSKRGKWWDRLALDLQKHLGLPDEARKACEDGLVDPHVRTAIKYSLTHRLTQIEASENGQQEEEACL